jgi:Na+-driven multidrug efflux pump
MDQPLPLLDRADPTRLRFVDASGLGPRGVFITIAIAQTTLAVVGVLLFRRGYWKKRSI